jgi:hypothetical protein
LAAFIPDFVRSAIKCALELSDSAKDLQREHALWRRRVDRIAERAKMNAALFEILCKLQKFSGNFAHVPHLIYKLH